MLKRPAATTLDEPCLSLSDDLVISIRQRFGWATRAWQVKIHHYRFSRATQATVRFNCPQAA
jgi:hypothetical protein